MQIYLNEDEREAIAKTMAEVLVRPIVNALFNNDSFVDATPECPDSDEYPECEEEHMEETYRTDADVGPEFNDLPPYLKVDKMLKHTYDYINDLPDDKMQRFMDVTSSLDKKMARKHRKTLKELLSGDFNQMGFRTLNENLFNKGSEFSEIMKKLGERKVVSDTARQTDELINKALDNIPGAWPEDISYSCKSDGHWPVDPNNITVSFKTR